MSVLQHVMQRASNKLEGEAVEFAFPAGPIRGRTSKLESVWTGIPPIDLAITGAVGGKWAAQKIQRRRAMTGLDQPEAANITVPVIIAFTADNAIVLDTGPIRKTWPRNQLFRVTKDTARASYTRTDIPVDTRFRLNGTEWMVHGRYSHAIRQLVERSTWQGVVDLR